MDHQGVMERTLTFFQFNWHRFELTSLFWSQLTQNRIHVVSEISSRQQIPAMAAGDVVHTAVFTCGIIETNPTRQVGHWLSPGPIRIILVPDNYTAVMSRLVKQLVVPEANRTSK